MSEKRLAVVTGAARGIGRAIALELMRQGCQGAVLDLNTELSKDWPVITEKIDAPPDAAEWEEVTDKLQYLER